MAASSSSRVQTAVPSLPTTTPAATLAMRIASSQSQPPARMVASAHTRIAAGSDEAQARQRLRGIPMAGQPRIVLRPHLEIHHDQVQAAHGATWGALPEEALFHARQRGLDEASAKSLILAGLARSVLAAAIDDADLPSELRLGPALEASLARELGAQEKAHG